ncbi:MAG: STAS domain-containing protein [Planctomycetes bacterium]|nr:STAS domain-containing protein [Planctomycetota bacterium]
MRYSEPNNVQFYPVDTPMFVDQETISRILGEVDMLLATGSFRHLVLDLSRVTWAGSPGVTLLLRLQARCDRSDRGFGLCGLQPTVREVLCITNLDRVFRIYEDADAAIECLAARETSMA